MPKVSTVGTVDTSILNTGADSTSSLNGSSKPRLGIFGKSGEVAPRSRLNGHVESGLRHQDVDSVRTKSHSRSREVKDSLTNGIKRLSILSTHSNITSATGLYGPPQLELTGIHDMYDDHSHVEDDEEKAWITQSDLSQAYHVEDRNGSIRSGAVTTSSSHASLAQPDRVTPRDSRRSGSAKRRSISATGRPMERVVTSLQKGPVGSHDNANSLMIARDPQRSEGGLAKAKGSVRKRMSIMNMGMKSRLGRKPSTLSNSVLEE